MYSIKLSLEGTDWLWCDEKLFNGSIVFRDPSPLSDAKKWFGAQFSSAFNRLQSLTHNCIQMHSGQIAEYFGKILTFSFVDFKKGTVFL
jgi:hypothetical protein